MLLIRDMWEILEQLFMIVLMVVVSITPMVILGGKFSGIMDWWVGLLVGIMEIETVVIIGLKKLPPLKPSPFPSPPIIQVEKLLWMLHLLPMSQALQPAL